MPLALNVRSLAFESFDADSCKFFTSASAPYYCAVPLAVNESHAIWRVTKDGTTYTFCLPHAKRFAFPIPLGNAIQLGRRITNEEGHFPLMASYAARLAKHVADTARPEFRKTARADGERKMADQGREGADDGGGSKREKADDETQMRKKKKKKPNEKETHVTTHATADVVEEPEKPGVEEPDVEEGSTDDVGSTDVYNTLLNMVLAQTQREKEAVPLVVDIGSFVQSTLASERQGRFVREPVQTTMSLSMAMIASNMYHPGAIYILSNCRTPASEMAQPFVSHVDVGSGARHNCKLFMKPYALVDWLKNCEHQVQLVACVPPDVAGVEAIEDASMDPFQTLQLSPTSAVVNVTPVRDYRQANIPGYTAGTCVLCLYAFSPPKELVHPCYVLTKKLLPLGFVHAYDETYGWLKPEVCD